MHLVAFYLCHLRWTEVMFSPLSVCLSICLLVCEEDVAKSCGWIQTKFDGQVGCATRMNRFNFGEYPDPDQRIF